MSIMALPCSLRTVFMMHFVYKGNHMIRHDFNCHINERERPKACLTNQKGSISHPIMPLVINNLGADTHTCMHTDIIQTSQTKKAISRNQLARAWFNKITGAYFLYRC